MTAKIRGKKKKKKKKKRKENKTLSNKTRLWKTKQDSGKQNNKNSTYKTRGQLPGCSIPADRLGRGGGGVGGGGARPAEILGCDYRLLLAGPSFVQRVPQRRVCLDKCTCCHTETEVADETCSYKLAIYRHRVNQSYHWPSFLSPPFLLFVSLPFTFTYGKLRDKQNIEWQQRSEEKKKKEKKKKRKENKTKLCQTKQDSGKQNKTLENKNKTLENKTKQDSGKQNNKNSMYKTRGKIPGCSFHTRRQMGARPAEILGCDCRLVLAGPSFIQRVPQRRVCLDKCTCCHTETEVADETCSYPLAIYRHRVNQSYHWPSLPVPSLPPLRFSSLHFHIRQIER